MPCYFVVNIQAIVIKMAGNTDLVLNLHGDACAAELIALIAQALNKRFVAICFLYFMFCDMCGFYLMSPRVLIKWPRLAHSLG